MKPQTFSILRNQWPTYTLLAILTILIWVGLPQLGIAPPISNKLYLTISIYLLWVLKLIFFDLSPSKAINANTEEEQKKIKILEGRLTGVLRFLRKTPIVYNKVRARFSILPWHLLIGPKGSGKTSMLAYSGMRFVLSKKFPEKSLSKIPSSTTSEWWVTRNLVLVDTPGSWPLWNNFIHLLQKKMIKPASIILTINLPELMQTSATSKWKKTIFSLKNQIENLHQAFGYNIGFHLVVTKCDKLSGFYEFFRDSSREDLASAWGAPIPQKSPKKNLQDIIVQQFNALIKQLNQQLVLRLHQERNSRLRPLIKDFPLEVEKLRDKIIQSINEIGTDLELQGIWLTSATQTPVENSINEIQSPSKQLANSLPQLSKAQIIPKKAYFIKHLIQHALPGWHGFQSKKQQHSKAIRQIIYSLCIAITVSAAIILGKDFYEGISHLHKLRAGIATFKQTQQQTKQLPPLTYTIQLLTTLTTDYNKNNHTISLLHRLPYFYSNKTEIKASKFYHEALKTLLLPSLSKSLDEWIKNIKHTTPNGQLYQVLKARLMLAGKIPTDYKQIEQALLTTGNLTFDKQTSHQLQILLDTSERLSLFQSINPKLLKKVRHRLSHMPAYLLGMLLLENNTSQVKNITENILQVPTLFTKQRYDEVINTDIPKAAFETLHGNSILGKITHHKRLDAHPAQTLIAQLRNRYKQNYVKAWAARLHQLKMSPPIDLFAADTTITEIANETNPVIQQLRAIYENTAFEPIMTMHPSLAEIDQLFTDTKNKKIWEQDTQQLNQLHYKLEEILTDKEPTQKAFQLVMQSAEEPDRNPFIRLNRLADRNPAPIRIWLKTLARTTWQQIINTSGAPTNQTSLNAVISDPDTFIAKVKKPIDISTSKNNQIPQKKAYRKQLTQKKLAKMTEKNNNPLIMNLSLPKPEEMLKIQRAKGVL